MMRHSVPFPPPSGWSANTCEQHTGLSTAWLQLILSASLLIFSFLAQHRCFIQVSWLAYSRPRTLLPPILLMPILFQSNSLDLCKPISHPHSHSFRTSHGWILCRTIWLAQCQVASSLQLPGALLLFSLLFFWAACDISKPSANAQYTLMEDAVYPEGNWIWSLKAWIYVLTPPSSLRVPQMGKWFNISEPQFLY